MKSRSLSLAVALVSSMSVPLLVTAAPVCPPEVREARELLGAKTVTAQKLPRTQAAARGQETQAPRGQETQAPRGQDLQAPRGQDLQAPRDQGAQASPRGQDLQAPRGLESGRATALANARMLVNEAEAACMDGDNARASSNARAAMELLRYLP